MRCRGKAPPLRLRPRPQLVLVPVLAPVPEPVLQLVLVLVLVPVPVPVRRHPRVLRAPPLHNKSLGGQPREACTNAEMKPTKMWYHINSKQKQSQIQNK